MQACVQSRYACMAGFQSSPAPKGRCYFSAKYSTHSSSVSILTGPEGPVLPAPVCTASVCTASGFNPHRPRRPVLRSHKQAASRRRVFQSSPAPKAGATRSVSVRHSCSRSGFQSSPAPKAGATLFDRQGHGRPQEFQSSPAPKGRCYINRDDARYGLAN